MADTPSIKPTNISSLPVGNATNIPVNEVTAATAAKPIITDAPVRQAPPQLTPPQSSVQGKVVASNPDTKEVTIRTAQGNVTIQSPLPLPIGSDVVINIYMQRGQMMASITLLKQQIDQAKLEEQLQKATEQNKSAAAVEKPAPPPAPPLKEGSKVMALPLQDNTTPIPLQKLLTLQEALKMNDLQTLRLPQALSPEVIQKLLEMPDIKNILQRLTPEVQKDIQRFLQGATPLNIKILAALPEPVRQILQNNLPPLQAEKSPFPSTNVPTTDAIDPLIQTISKPVLHSTSDKPVTSSPQQIVPKTLTNLISLLQSMTGDNPKNAAPAPMIIQNSEDALLPLPKNIVQMTMVKIFPSATPLAKVEEFIQKQATTNTPLQMAEVESITDDGFPILKTVLGHFVLKTPASIPVGSFIAISPEAMTPEQIMAGFKTDKTLPSILQPKGSFDPLMSTQWPALDDVLQTLQQSTSPAAQAFHNSIPTPSPKLVATALFFLAVLRNGNIDNWLGDNTLKALKESGKKDLLEKLGGDFSRLANQAKESLSDNWRSISIPLLHDDHISQMHFFVRQQHDQESSGESADAKPTTRFILNMELSRMGDMQLDGLIRKKNFNMIMRTQEKLPFEMRQELMQKFAQALDQVNMEGGITFQAKAQNWVTIDLPHQNGVTA